MFVFDIFAFNIFAFDIFSFDIFPFDIFPFDIFPFDIFPFNIFPFNIFPFDIFPFNIFPFDIFPFNILYSHLIYSHLIYSHLIYLPFKFTSIIFQKIRRCAPHIETYQPPPTLTLGSTFHIQYRHIHITASRLFHSQQPLRPFSSIGSTFRIQYRSIQTQVNKTPTLHNQALKKKPEGCAEGPRLCGPFAVFLFSQKNTASVRQPERNTVFFKSIFLHFVT